MVLYIEKIGGLCPVQAEGTIDGKPFYFRARHRQWSIGIGDDPVGAPEWHRREAWGDGPYAAGYRIAYKIRALKTTTTRE